MKRYYLAYGSNLNTDQMLWRCPGAWPLGIAELEGYHLLFKGSKTGAYLTIEPKEGSRVPVAVWEVTEDDEKSLDRYEGFPTFYYKKEMKVKYTGIKTGRNYTRNAFVYIMHEDRKCGKPSQRYMLTCLEGYRDFGFDERYLTRAIFDSIEGMKEGADEND